MRGTQTLIYKSKTTWRILAAMCFLSVLPARANVILTIQSLTANSNTTGNFLDVILTNTGPSSVSIDGFFFGFQTADTNISFTDVTTNTALGYIFAGNSLFGPDLTGPISGQSVNTGDLASGAAATVGSGSTVGLGHVFFNVAAGDVPGVHAVTFVPASTSLSDAAGAPVTINTLVDGAITVSSTVPEPSFVMPLASVLFFGLVTQRFRTKTAR
jgi:hypothetical protein